MSKKQDGNGSSFDNGEATFEKRKPQEKLQQTVPETPGKTEDDDDIDGDKKGLAANIEVKEPRHDGLECFQNTADLPVDLNAADVKRLMNEYFARLNKGLRT